MLLSNLPPIPTPIPTAHSRHPQPLCTNLAQISPFLCPSYLKAMTSSLWHFCPGEKIWFHSPSYNYPVKLYILRLGLPGILLGLSICPGWLLVSWDGSQYRLLSLAKAKVTKCGTLRLQFSDHDQIPTSSCSGCDVTNTECIHYKKQNHWRRWIQVT